MSAHVPSEEQAPFAAVEPKRVGTPAVAWIIGLLLAAVLGTLLFVAGYLFASSRAVATAGCAAPSEAFQPFCEAYERLKTEYVDPLDDTKLAEGALRGMFEYGVGDPYSAYMPPEVYQEALGGLSGRFEGIGAEMGAEDPATGKPCDTQTLSETCALVVVAPLAGTPAEKAGLRPGDIVLTVDGESVNDTSMEEQVHRVRGPAGTDVTLGIQRGDERFEVTITRAEIVIPEVEARLLDPGVGYIALKGFSDKSSGEFRDSLATLLEDGARQIIFDLRNNPGGYIEAAQEIASQFIADGVIFTQESNGEEPKVWTATPGGVATDPSIEVVVLTNGGSASASEIVAGALKDRGRATIIGEPTFGKDTVQVWAPLANQGGMRITISRWFTPNHTSVEGGLKPDIAVDIPDDATAEDELNVLLERARAHLDGRAADETSARGDRQAAQRPHVTFMPDGVPQAAWALGLAAYSPEATSARLV